jgi:hypothetical protein
MSIATAVSDVELRCTVEGLTTQSEWTAGLRAALETLGDAPPRHLVIDCRKANDTRTTDQLREIVDLLGKYRSALADRCVLQVATNACYGAGRMMGVFLEAIGLHLLVTMHSAEADAWIAGVTTAGPTATWPTETAGW